MKKLAVVAICLVSLSGSAIAQDARTVIAGAQQALGGVKSITYSGTATDVEDGTLPAGAFTWQVDYITGQVLRPLVAPTTGSTSGSFPVPRLTPYTGTDVLYRVTLTVTDSDGLSTTTSHDLELKQQRVEFYRTVDQAKALVAKVPDVPVTYLAARPVQLPRPGRWSGCRKGAPTRALAGTHWPCDLF